MSKNHETDRPLNIFRVTKIKSNVRKIVKSRRTVN